MHAHVEVPWPLNWWKGPVDALEENSGAKIVWTLSFVISIFRIFWEAIKDYQYLGLCSMMEKSIFYTPRETKKLFQ